MGTAAAVGPLAVTTLLEPDPTDHPGFLTVPTAAVTLTGLAPGTRLLLRSRCVAGGGVWRWELPWSEAAVAATLRPPRHAPSEHPPQVLWVMGTLVALRVRNPGKLAVRMGAPDVGGYVVDCVAVRALLLSLLAMSRGRPYAQCHADFPGGAAATTVVVEGNGAAVPCAVAELGFMDGLAVVTVSGLTPGTQYSLRCRCQLEDPEVDANTLWSPVVDVVTLDVARLEVGLVCALSSLLCESCHSRRVSLRLRTVVGGHTPCAMCRACVLSQAALGTTTVERDALRSQLVRCSLASVLLLARSLACKPWAKRRPYSVSSCCGVCHALVCCD